MFLIETTEFALVAQKPRTAFSVGTESMVTRETKPCSVFGKRAEGFVSALLENGYFWSRLNIFGAFVCFVNIRVSPFRTVVAIYLKYAEDTRLQRHRSKVSQYLLFRTYTTIRSTTFL